MEHIQRKGLSDVLNLYVVKKVISDIESTNLRNMKISINISPLVKNFTQHLGSLVDIVRNSKFKKLNTLKIELTESAFVDDIQEIQIAEITKILSNENITLAIDDFGVEHSSISRIVKYDTNTTKIDMSFVQNLNGEIDKNYVIVKAIISVSQYIGIDVVAEGVETKLQEKILSELGCNYAQGFLYSRGLRKENLENYNVGSS